MNLPLVSSLDSTASGSVNRMRHTRASLNVLLSSYGLNDVWRHKGPFDRGFSFFPAVHLSCSRIDLFMIPKGMIEQAQINVHPRIVSDHNS